MGKGVDNFPVDNDNNWYYECTIMKRRYLEVLKRKLLYMKISKCQEQTLMV